MGSHAGGGLLADGAEEEEERKRGEEEEIASEEFGKIACSVNHPNNDEGVAFNSVDNEIGVDAIEQVFPRGNVITGVPKMWMSLQLLDCGMNRSLDTICGGRVVLSDVIPN